MNMRSAGGENDGKWEFWIDRGGTFTDVVARICTGIRLFKASKMFLVCQVMPKYRSIA